MKAGKNTPESVIRYIDAVWAMGEGPDPVALAVQLGYGPKAIRKLKEKHGDGFRAYLLKVKRLRTEPVRLLDIRHLYEDPTNMTTIVPLNDKPPNPPEPERIGKVDEAAIVERSSEAEIMYLRQHWTAKRLEFERLISELRNVGLHDRELWIIERRMAKLDSKLMRGTATA